MLVALLGAVMLIRLVALVVSPSELGFDEAQYWAWSRHFAFGYFTKPPMIAWIISLETHVCGSGPACVRAASPIFHFGTALVLAALGARLYGRAAGIWTGIFYAIMPGIALSSFLITTDVFLLFFWSVALYALVEYVERPRLWPALVFGVATGLGLYAKYAMVYLPALAVLAAVALPWVRRALMRREAAVGLVLALLVVAPNLWWNAAHGFATFEHTGDNIGWSLSRLNATAGFEFFAAQFAVAGPAVLLAMLAALFLGTRTDRPDTDRLLLWLSWPVIAAITLQGFLSHANANWAATAYPAGIVLATGLIVRLGWRFFLVSNLVVCGLASLVVLVGSTTVEPTTASGPFRQMRQLGGWDVTAAGLEQVATQTGAKRIVVNGRAITAGLIYALRNSSLPVLAYRPRHGPATDQFQLDQPWMPGDETEGTLFFGLPRDAAEVLGAHEVAAIPAPIYSARHETMPVYGF